MTTDFEKESIKDLTRRKEISRRAVRNLSASEKMAQLKFLQWRYYNLLAVRASGGGREIPEKWRKWRTAQIIVKN